MTHALKHADVYIPDGTDELAALRRTTHLCIGAHQDDQEFMAFEGIQSCFGRTDAWFTGVVLTDGGGSARSGVYADYSDDDMKAVRLQEQRKAAMLGEYSAQLQLGYRSAEVKDATNPDVVADLTYLLETTRPTIVYLHNPADKHDTHVASFLRALTALRALAPEARPAKVLGCEIWRDLDWLCDEDKQILPCDRHPNLAAALSGVFDSQITGGKRYDLAVAGRRAAHATFFESHATDAAQALNWAMDLTPLLANPGLEPNDFVQRYIQRFADDVANRIAKFQ